jgi:CRISPR-associated protein Csx16
MTTWFVSRHPGACEWVQRQGVAIDAFVPHLEIEKLQPGDLVIGTLPVNLIAAVQDRGCGYLNLSMELPRELRGRELTADQLNACGARLQAYRVEKTALPEPR